MINIDNAQILWNIKENRPARPSEMRRLTEEGMLFFNWTIGVCDGKFWADLDDKVDGKTFEIRKV